MKRVLITGGSDGIGKAIVELLNKPEYELFIFGRSKEKLDSIDQTNIKKKYCFDMLNKSDLYGALKDINLLGGVDILINNAGANLAKASILDMNITDLEKMLQLNTVAQVICIQEMGKVMLEKHNGFIVNVLSSCCKFNNPTIGAYTASKDAFEAISKVLVKEVKEKGIKVLDIYPGGVDTSFRKNDRPDYLRPETIAKHIVYAIENNEDGMIQEIVCRPIVENNY